MTEAIKREIVFWDIDKLIPYPKNAKKHAQEHIDRLARSIAKLGLTPPMIEGNQPGCTPGMIIAGHGRRLALLQLGRLRVPVDIRDDLTKTECDALRIADNAAVSNEMDYTLMTEEIVRLQADDFDVTALGMTEKEIALTTIDIGEIDDSAFTEDITTAVEEQKTENAAAEAAIDGKEGPVSEALGFKKVTTEQSRIIRGFIANIEANTSLKGAAALISFIQSDIRP